MASAVRTRPARSRLSSSGWNPGISLVLVSTSTWARTPRLVWSIAASRWTCGLPWWPLPRRVLPSTATACRHGRGGGDGGGGWWWLLGSQPGADGTVQRVGVDAGQDPAHGRLARWPPGAGQVAAHPERGQHLAGASLAHSPIAARDLAPVSTAATATASTVASACRRPRRWRGSVIWAR